MNIVKAIEEFVAETMTDGYESGFLLCMDSHEGYSWEQFYLTEAEAKAKASELEFSHEKDLIVIYEGEFRTHDWDNDNYHARNFSEVYRRVPTQKEVDMFRAQVDIWQRDAEYRNSAWWDIRDWLSGQTPSPTWG
jgi:hypothetical protein